jgi:sugar/nucleoside kinase (ribokinase family)
VYPIPLNGLILPTENRTAAFLSLEDLGFDRSQLDHLRTMFPLLVLTKGKDGTEIFQGKEIINIPADQAEELDPTGAGDIFAAGFMIYWVFRGKSIREAGRLASRLATISITRPGLDGIPTIAEINKIEQN